MAKSLVEMAAEIVQAQAKVTRMSAEEIGDALNKSYEALSGLKASEEAVEPVEVPVKKRVEGKASIQRAKVVCLECGKDFKQLSKRHLGSHGLTAKDYKKKHGIPLGQALVAKSLSAQRSKVAREKGLGKKLAEARKRKAKA